MLRAAQSIELESIDLEFVEAVAENLPFADGEFDLVFCHALFKHLPEDVQAAVTLELARVSTRYVIITLSVNRGIPGLIRRFRKARGAVAVSSRWAENTFRESGLRIISRVKTATPLGVEHSYLLEKAPSDKA
jgi:ubiquinone/menaquinone biosynthesis C-methylase UbiE